MALTRITKGVIKPNENYDTHNINSTGIVTAIGLDVNGNGDISGNLSVGGVLTYEDVTSIDSVGIITARDGIHVGAGVSAVGVGTFGGLDVNGNGDVSGNLSVSSLLTAGDLSVTGTGVVGDFKSTNNNYVLGLLGNNASVKVFLGTDSSGNFKLATGSGVGQRLHINTIGHTVVTGSTTAFNGVGPQNGLQMYYNTTNGLAYIGSYSGGGNTNLLFYTNSGGAGATQKFKILHTGHIVTGNLSSYSFNNDTSNAKIFEVTGDGTVGEYGVINISGNQNTDHNNIGNLRFVNRENSNTNSGGY